MTHFEQSIQPGTQLISGRLFVTLARTERMSVHRSLT